MRSKSTLVGIFYVATGLLAAFVLSKIFRAVFGAVGVNDAELYRADTLTIFVSTLCGIALAAILTAVFFTTGPSRRLVGECFEELYKVNWPTWAETKVNTLVVIITSVVSSVILGIFDMTFGWLSQHNLFLN